MPSQGPQRKKCPPYLTPRATRRYSHRPIVQLIEGRISNKTDCDIARHVSYPDRCVPWGSNEQDNRLWGNPWLFSTPLQLPHTDFSLSKQS